MVYSYTYKQLLYFFGIFLFQVAVGEGLSQTESYLSTLGTRQQAYEKIAKILVVPDTGISINPQEHEELINKIIAAEKAHSDYYALYHGAQLSNMIMILFSTYLTQMEYNWNRDDFFILRFSESFYKQLAPTAADYIRQNLPSIAKQVHAAGFDMVEPYRSQLLAMSIALISYVDDTPLALRKLLEGDTPAWESTFYYFAAGLTWTKFDVLHGIIMRNVKNYNLTLFNDDQINVLTRRYIDLSFQKALYLIRKSQEKATVKTGMLLQMFIPKNVIDDIAYLAWTNGIIWLRQINGITAGWDATLGTYTKLSAILDLVQKDPLKLGRSLHVLEARLIFKDLKYLFYATSPLKMHIITTLESNTLNKIKDILKDAARIVVENKKATQTGTLEQWAQSIDLQSKVQKLEQELTGFV
jgi:hypothetical protein